MVNEASFVIDLYFLSCSKTRLYLPSSHGKKIAPNSASFQTCFPLEVAVLGEFIVWEAGASGAGGVHVGDQGQ